LNPGVFLGLGPCTLQGVLYPTCTTAANLEQRRVFTLENPREGGCSPMCRNTRRSGRTDTTA
jgi:hypothetical protein